MLDLNELKYISKYDYGYDKLKQTEKICKKIITYMLDYKGSIRQCSKETCISSTTIHRYVHTYIKTYYYEEYRQILKILKFNSQNRRKARKYWKGKPW